jgi:DNA replication and repair protein RecF
LCRPTTLDDSRRRPRSRPYLIRYEQLLRPCLAPSSAPGRRSVIAEAALIVEHVSLRDFRSYSTLELDLPAGLVLVTGPNGVGKTNLLEALHVGSQGFSPRTRAEARLVRFGQAATRVALAGREGGTGVRTEVTIEPRERKSVTVNGAALAGGEELRTRLVALAFLPDRLAVVKGGPLVRRTYVDRMLGRVFPARAGFAADYGRALAQRNEALRRVRAGASSRAAVAPWTERVAAAGTELDLARAELVALLAAGYAESAGLLGLGNAVIRYNPRPLEPAALEERLDRDIERGATGIGPHLRDVGLCAGDRDLRSFGSQGEQRSAVLALVLAEAGLLGERRGAAPLLLLDDVFSELDESRRRALLRSLPNEGQTVVTATSEGALPCDARSPDAVVRVTPGEAVAA